MANIHDQYVKQLNSFYWENDYSPDSQQIDLLARFAALVVEKNETLNLISRKDIQAIIENHVFISAYLANFIPERCTRFLDIGTGGGFPGIPLGIVRPEMRGVLVDSIRKKVDAVHSFVEKLLLGNVIVENDRVESPEFIQKYRQSFDLFVSRATVPLSILMRYAMPLFTDRAYVLAMKGGNLSEELDQMTNRYGTFIKKQSVFELHYKPTNMKNEKGKKLVVLELMR